LFWSFFYLSWFVFNNLWTTNISLILLIFRFIKIEPARVITSVFKLLIEIPLFQLSQVCRHPDWKPYIDAWFRRFGVSVNYFLCYIEIIDLFFIIFLYTEQIQVG
jgi:hypothetical protein